MSNVSRLPVPYRKQVVRGQGGVFAYEEDNTVYAPNHYEEGAEYPLYNRVNQSLKLAEQHNFLKMCEGSLWGAEADDSAIKHEFGEFLRGIVETFKPKTAAHLRLLKNVVDAQWGLERASRYRKGIFDNNMNERGSHGMAAGTELGLRYNRVSKEWMDLLERSISAYNKALEREY
jgi:hypothetical protein